MEKKKNLRFETNIILIGEKLMTIVSTVRLIRIVLMNTCLKSKAGTNGKSKASGNAG